MAFKFLKTPEPMRKTLETSAYTAGGMLLNRFIAPQVLSLIQPSVAAGKEPLGPNAQLVIRALTGLLLGSISMQLIKKKDISVALTVGALADVIVGAWNTFGPEQLRFAGAQNMGLIIPMEQTPVQQLPPGMPFSGLGYQVTQEVMPYAYN